MKKLQHSLILFLVASLLCCTVQMANSTSTYAAEKKVIHTKTKKQAKKAFKKAWKCYEKNIPFYIVFEYGKKDKVSGMITYTGKGEEKYRSRAKKAMKQLLQKIKKQSGLKWIPEPESTYGFDKCDIVSYKREIKYIEKITKSINEEIKSANVENDYYKLSEVIDNYFETKINCTRNMRQYKDKRVYEPDSELYNNNEYKSDCWMYNDAWIYRNIYIGIPYENTYLFGSNEENECDKAEVICKAMGYKTRRFKESKSDDDNEVLCIAATDSDGTKYWQSVIHDGDSRTWDSKDKKVGEIYVSKWEESSVAEEAKNTETITTPTPVPVIQDTTPAVLDVSMSLGKVKEGEIFYVNVTADKNCTFSCSEDATISSYCNNACTIEVTKNGTYTVTATTEGGAITTNTFEVTAFYKPEDLIVDMEDYFA